MRYNCRVVLLNRKVILIRPKMVLADSGNYHESRYFARWPRSARRLDEHHLPRSIREITGDDVAPFGEALISTRDSCIGFEICEEFFVSNAPHTTMALAGVEIFSNGSASHHELGKFRRKYRMLVSSMSRAGGIYLYSNALGCDGDRLYHDGGSLILQNDRVMQFGGLFSLSDVVVVASAVDLESVRTFRGTIQSMGGQAQYATWDYPRITIDFALSEHGHLVLTPLTSPSTSSSTMLREETHIPSEEDELLTAPALWLFDYLRRSKAGGFFLALSGGIDSGSIALIIFHLSQILADACSNNCLPARQFVQGHLGLTDEEGACDAHVICHRLLLTAFMGTENSSEDSNKLAAALAQALGAHHISFNFDRLVSAFISIVATALRGFVPRYTAKGGSNEEDLALQNMQARLRLVLSYAIAQIAPLALAQRGPLLVLATANALECVTGYYTKYDSSSGDINPIGSLNKDQIRTMVTHGARLYPALRDVLGELLSAVPRAELAPNPDPKEGSARSDELEMGMTYDFLKTATNLRGINRCGPNDMLATLNENCPEYAQRNSELVRRFFTRYTRNRHKACSLPPAFHANPTSPDDNRHDIRPLIYPDSWTEILTEDLDAFSDEHE